jgi:hypothetical protein
MKEGWFGVHFGERDWARTSDPQVVDARGTPLVSCFRCWFVVPNRCTRARLTAGADVRAQTDTTRVAAS